MRVIVFIVCLIAILLNTVYPLSTRRAVDDVIRLRLLKLVHSAALADGIVLAGTIVEGGPVFDRRRQILGGKKVNSGKEYFQSIEKLEKCPALTLWYRCRNWVPTECEVIRYLLFRSKICTCRVNVC